MASIPTRKTTKLSHPAASVVDVFCGAGGLTHGFRTQGFPIAAGVDLDESCRHAFQSNNDAPFIRRNVAKLKAAEVSQMFHPGVAQILVGCAPCQPFSTYNQKNDDPKWRLLGKFADLVDGVQPDVVSMENVPRLLTFKGGSVFNEFVKRLHRAGYFVKWDTLFGPDFGMAQTRRRLVLLASKLGPIALPVRRSRRCIRTVREAIGSLPPLAHGEIDAHDPIHRASKLSSRNLKRMKASKPGGTWRDWDKRLVAACHKSKAGDGYSAVYGRMEWDKPAPTITTQFYGFGNGRFGHPEQDRGLSLREGAILQGFPRDYEFVAPGDRIQFTALGRMIGNAVPVQIASEIARAVAKHLRSVS